MPTKTFFSLLLIISLAAGVWAGAQVARAAQRLESDKPIEREIAGGEAHTYQLELAAGQFVRIAVDQKGIDVALKLTAPDAKQLIGSQSHRGWRTGLAALTVEALDQRFALSLRI